MGQTQKPERKVEGNILRSAHDPAIRIQLPKAVTYAGADRWILYGVADCELHAFAETDAKNNVNGLYWVQFKATFHPGQTCITATIRRGTSPLPERISSWIRGYAQPTNKSRRIQTGNTSRLWSARRDSRCRQAWPMSGLCTSWIRKNAKSS